MNLMQLFAENGINLEKKQIKQFEMYYDFLLQENEKYNLTSITQKEDVYVKHFLDSILPYKEFKGAESVCDIGAGAGFPSLPLKIIYPDLKVTLFDSVQKKVNFLNELIFKLGFDNCVAIHSRAEDAARIQNFRENFDIVVSRAVAELRVLNEYCLPFVKMNGKFLAYKGSHAESEIECSKKSLLCLCGKVESIIKFKIYNMERNILVIKKTGAIDKKYPRKGNKPRTNPL